MSSDKIIMTEELRSKIEKAIRSSLKTNKEIANMINVSESSISRYVTGKCTFIYKYVIESLEYALNVKLLEDNSDNNNYLNIINNQNDIIIRQNKIIKMLNDIIIDLRNEKEK